MAALIPPIYVLLAAPFKRHVLWGVCEESYRITNSTRYLVAGMQGAIMTR